MRVTSSVSLIVGAVALACSSHPAEGTVVSPAPGVMGVPGGAKGVSASRAVPISGGTLIIAKDGVMAIASDPDRDRVFLVNLDARNVATVVLDPGDEPGRAAEDDEGRVHVALRNGGVASIDLGSGTVVERRNVCPAPRGIAHDGGKLHVACDTGELVTIPTRGGETLRRLDLGRGLRDVIVDYGRLLVSRFRTAELLAVAEDGTVTSIVTPVNSGLAPDVAWRTLRRPDNGEVLMLHQRVSTGAVSVAPGGYGASPCGGSIVEGTISALDPDASPDNPRPPPVALPMIVGPSDLAVSRDGLTVAVVATGNSWQLSQGASSANNDGFPGASAPERLFVSQQPVVARFTVGELPFVDPCGQGTGVREFTGEPTAVAFDGRDRVIVQSREPAQLQILGGATISLSTDSRADTGVALFHANTGGGISCASCHPEGRDDGRVWTFDGLGARRTQSFGGGFLGTEPFHWDGSLEDFGALVHEVFQSRMGAPQPNGQQTAHFAAWLDTIPAATPRVTNRATSERGRALFESEAVGCATCHSGPQLTNNRSADVGTGGVLQVPTLLGISARAPFLHSGCAPTLLDRFGDCGGGDRHGKTSQLDDSEIAELVTYLEAL